MADVDLKLIKLVQQCDDERRKRILAERSASALRAMNTKLRQELAVATRDQAPTVEQSR